MPSWFSRESRDSSSLHVVVGEELLQAPRANHAPRSTVDRKDPASDGNPDSADPETPREPSPSAAPGPTLRQPRQPRTARRDETEPQLKKATVARDRDEAQRASKGRRPRSKAATGKRPTPSSEPPTPLGVSPPRPHGRNVSAEAPPRPPGHDQTGPRGADARASAEASEANGERQHPPGTAPARALATISRLVNRGLQLPGQPVDPRRLADLGTRARDWVSSHRTEVTLGLGGLVLAMGCLSAANLLRRR